MEKIGKIFIGLVAAFMVVVFVIMIFLSVFIFFKSYIDYLENSDDLVPITATVSHICEYEDSDDDTYYEIYLTYEYNGKIYENIYWEDTYKDHFKVGKEITVEISCVNPKYIRKTDIGGRLLIIMLIAFSVILAVVIYSAGFYKIKSTDDIRVIDENAIARELSPRAIFAFLNAVIGFGVSLYGTSLFSPELITNTNYAIWSVIGGLVLFLWVVLRMRKRGIDEYSITTNLCVGKWRESDGDSCIDYVKFENIPGDIRAERKVYAHSEEGKYYYVLSNKKGEIREVYDAEKWALKVDRDNFDKAGRNVILNALKNVVFISVAMFCVSFMFEVVAQFLVGKL